MATEVLERAPERLTRRRATVEEFWSLPESLRHIEYINGEIIEIPTPTIAHQSALRNIFSTLHTFVWDKSLKKSPQDNVADRLFFAPLDVALPSGDVIQPDIFFLAKEGAERARRDDRVRCAPLFAVEILSPVSITLDTLTKRALYERNGVREYWIVDVDGKSIAQLVLRKKHYVLTELGESGVIKGAVLAGFEANVGELLG